jgi:hypothetical protein
MRYSIEILEKERDILRKCLSEWQSENYPDAKKEREKRFNDIDECISILKCVNDGINPFSESAFIHGLNLTK